MTVLALSLRVSHLPHWIWAICSDQRETRETRTRDKEGHPKEDHKASFLHSLRPPNGSAYRVLQCSNRANRPREITLVPDTCRGSWPDDIPRHQTILDHNRIVHLPSSLGSIHPARPSLTDTLQPREKGQSDFP
jgi:hypothetical protein